MRTTTACVAMAVLTASLACSDLNVPDFNNTSLDDLLQNPTRTKIATAAQGLLVGSRIQMGTQNGYVSLLGILGRESYNFDPADPRFITEMLIGPLDGGSPAFGGNLFALPYRNIRNAHILLAAVDAVPGMTSAEQEAVRGFAKTMQALDFLIVVNTRGANGAPIDVDLPPTGPPAPIASRDEVFAHIATLLDEGHTHLLTGGGAFPFALSPGFAEFATPVAFARFNRALRARVAVYRGNHAAALTALGASFVDTTASLDLGAYHSYSTGSGDLQNLLFDPTGRAILAHPSIVTDARTKPGGELDARVLRKVETLPDPRTVQGITTNLVFTIYNSNTAPIPIIRNEELILLRAEANLFLGNLDAAARDINVVRTRSGGLLPLPVPYPGTQAQLLVELLYERRYSLLFEGGHRWIDARRHGRLDTLPRAVGTHNIFDRFPFPEAECLTRSPAPSSGC